MLLKKEQRGKISSFLIATMITLVAFYIISWIAIVSKEFIIRYWGTSARIIIQETEAIKNPKNNIDLNWTIENLAGEKENIIEKTKNKAVFLNFWATWCPPCVKEMPSIQKLYEKFKDNRNIVFLMVSSESEKEVENFMNVNSYTFPVYITDINNLAKMHINFIPVTFIISQKGEIIERKTGSNDWSSEKVSKSLKILATPMVSIKYIN